MARCLSFTGSADWLYRNFFSYSGLRSVTTDLEDGTVMHCWAPKTVKPTKPNLLLVHGFGANAMWQYGDLLRHFMPRFNIYVPDLLFFGHSTTKQPERTEAFQAQCVMRLMERYGVQKLSLVGISYGGFVGYSMAAQFPQAVEKVVLCCTGVCLEEKDMRDGLFQVADLDEAASILMPQTPDKLRELMKFAFVKPVKVVPSCFLSDYIDVFCTDHVKQKKELIQAILKERQISNIPKIRQSTLIIWGEQDRIFPVELGHRLQTLFDDLVERVRYIGVKDKSWICEVQMDVTQDLLSLLLDPEGLFCLSRICAERSLYIGEKARLVVIKNAGHAVNIEKPKEFSKELKSFLQSSSVSHSSQSQQPKYRFFSVT